MRLTRKSGIYAFALFVAVSALGQERTVWKTADDVRDGSRGSAIGSITDVEEGRRRFTMMMDDDRYAAVTVEVDSVSTRFNGFGGTINGSPEVFVGGPGFSNIRVGDRVEVRGNGRSRGTIAAETITLLGRSVAAAQTGVGQTRTPDSISTPTARGTTPSTSAATVGRVEGIVRQVNPGDGRVVVETSGRQMINVRATSATPVYYKNDVYRLDNLEVGDRIRVEPEGGSTTSGEIRARTIDVLQSVGDSQGGTSTGRSVGNLTGRVTRVDRAANVVRIETGRGEIRVDLTSAADTQGRPVRASDIQAGDRLDLSGTYSGDVFVASTIRFADDTLSSREPAAPAAAVIPSDLGAVTLYATVSQSLTASPQLVVRDTQNNRTLRVYVLEDFVYRTKTGTYATADKLKEGDSLVIKAYRDADGNYIAQTIRQR
jgi:hypothetical protein